MKKHLNDEKSEAEKKLKALQDELDLIREQVVVSYSLVFAFTFFF